MSVYAPALTKNPARGLWLLKAAGAIVVSGLLAITILPAADHNTLSARDAALPDRTPNGVLIENRTHFYRLIGSVFTDADAMLKLTDGAIALARASGLQCPSVSYFSYRGSSDIYKLSCNQHRYNYVIEDKGRGWRARIDE
jgi:hypothetical protein